MNQVKTQSSFKLTYIVLIAVSCYSLLFTDYWKQWNDSETPFRYDSAISYWYVPSTFVYHNYKTVHERNPYVWYNEQGQLVPKYTYGMAVMYTPFFFLGHKFAMNAHEKLDGYSLGYIKAIHYGCVIYGLLGLLFLGKILLRYFSDIITAATLLLIFFGSNLMIYTLLDSERVHCSLFFLNTLFVWLTIKWHEKPSRAKSIVIGFILGLITVVRPTDIIIGLIFVFFGVQHLKDIPERMKFFWKEKTHSILILSFFVLMIIPQLLFWKHTTGSFLYYNYGNEKFFWTNPALFKYLFGYRNGWFLYAPIMFIAFIGLFFSRKLIPALSRVSLVYVLLNIYILSCWWCWWFMGYGNRSAIQSYPVMALGLATVLHYISQFSFFKNKANLVLKYSAVLVLSLLFSLNLLQSYQYRNWMIHYEGMNKKTYWILFGKFSLNEKEQEEFNNNLTQVNWEDAMQGKDRW